eukprot:g901.t1
MDILRDLGEKLGLGGGGGAEDRKKPEGGIFDTVIGTVSSSSPGAPGSVQDIRALNADWSYYNCDDPEAAQGVQCSNVMEAMRQCGLSPPRAAERAEGLIRLGPPEVVQRPRRMVTETDYDKRVSCANLCGYFSVVAAVAAKEGVAMGLAAQQQSQSNDDAASRKQQDIATAAAGASVGVGSLFACNMLCGSTKEKHDAAGDPWVLGGSYRHEAPTRSRAERFASSVVMTSAVPLGVSASNLATDTKARCEQESSGGSGNPSSPAASTAAAAKAKPLGAKTAASAAMSPPVTTKETTKP